MTSEQRLLDEIKADILDLARFIRDEAEPRDATTVIFPAHRYTRLTQLFRQHDLAATAVAVHSEPAALEQDGGACPLPDETK